MEKLEGGTADLRAVPTKAQRLIGCFVLLLLAFMLVSIVSTSTPVSGMSFDSVSTQCFGFITDKYLFLFIFSYLSMFWYFRNSQDTLHDVY